MSGNLGIQNHMTKFLFQDIIYLIIPYPLPKRSSVSDSFKLTSIFMQISLELLRGTVIHLQSNVKLKKNSDVHLKKAKS